MGAGELLGLLGWLFFKGVGQGGFAILAKRTIQADERLAHGQKFADARSLEAQVISEFVWCRLTPQVLQKRRLRRLQAAKVFAQIDGQTNGPGLVGERPPECLANPPGGIGAELAAARGVEALDRAYEAKIALLNEILQVESTSLVFFGKTDDQAQVRLDQKPSGLLIPHVQAVRDVPLLCCGEER